MIIQKTIQEDLFWENKLTREMDVIISKDSVFEFQEPRSAKTMKINGKRMDQKQYLKIVNVINEELRQLMASNDVIPYEGSKLSKTEIISIIKQSLIQLTCLGFTLEPFSPMIDLIKKDSNLKKYFKVKLI